MTRSDQIETTASIEIACCFDGNMLIGAELLIKSISRNCSSDRPVTIHAITHSGEKLDLGPLCAAAASHVTIVPHLLSGLPFPAHGFGPGLTEACYYRFLLADILFDLPKVLYLDCDLIVLRDLASLFDIDLANDFLGAVPDFCLTRSQQDWTLACGDHALRPEVYIERLCRTFPEDYFNTGVMLLNLTAWRRVGLIDELSAFAITNPEMQFPDQDALNFVVKNRYRKLDVRWNVLGGALLRQALTPNDLPDAGDMLESARHDPWIVHFAGPRKPWHADAPITIRDVEMRAYLPAISPLTPAWDAHTGSRRSTQSGSGALSPAGGGRLPFVSIIVVNFNYAKFLRSCIESIVLQDYPAFECVVIDNASTDGSDDILKEIDGFAGLVSVVRSPTNIGQGAAWALGLSKTSGQYVMFVDADDYLLPQAIKYHVHTHLSLKHATGLTSSDMIQVLDDRIVLGTFFEAAHSRPKNSYRELNSASLTDIVSISRDAKQVFSDVPPVPLLEIHRKNTSWVWSPTSANMYRRDALGHFVECEALSSFRVNADAFFNYAVHSFFGSVLIDKPLSAYRFHGGNSFARGVALFNCSASRNADDGGSRAAHLILEYVLENFPAFEQRMLSPALLLESMATLQKRASEHRFGWVVLKRAYVSARRGMIASQSRALRKYFS